MEVQLYSLLNSLLFGVSGQPRVLSTTSLWEGAPVTHWIWGWVVPTVSHDVLEERKISCPCQNKFLVLWCIRYAVMMEPHLLSLWLCLKDMTVDVRLTTLTCLVELLQGDYIKFRGAMFFHLLSMLCDSDEMVVELTAHCFRDCLVVKNKNIMSEHLVDAVFHYNGYQVSFMYCTPHWLLINTSLHYMLHLVR